MTPRPPAGTMTDTRDRILDAARTLFGARGVEATTMRAIATEVGTSAAAIYHHFADKDTLIRALMVTDLRRLGASFARAQRVPDPIERLHELGMAYVRFGLEHPQHYRMLFMLPDAKTAALEQEITREIEATPEEDAYGILYASVTAALEAGRFGPDFRDAERVSQMCWATVHGLVSLDIVFAGQQWLEWRDPIVTADRALRALLTGLQQGASR